MDNDTRSFVRTRYGALPLHCADQSAYDHAVDAYQETGNRTALMTTLARLGLAREEVHWHLEHRGQRRITVWS